MHTAEIAKVAASTMNAHPVPAVETTAAPIIGPATSHANGRTVEPIEFASTRCSSGTIDGMIELKAGQKIAWPAPYGNTRATRSGAVSASRMISVPIAVMATRRRRSPMIIRCRRSMRSDRAPVAINNRTCGSDHANPTNENVAGDACKSR